MSRADKYITQGAEFMLFMKNRKYDPNQPRDNRGRWTDAGGSLETNWNIEGQTKAHNEFGGSSFDQQGNNLIGKKGYASVSPYLERTVILAEGEELTPEVLSAYYELNADILAGKPDHFVGTWFDAEDSKQTFLDISIARPVDEAIQLGIEHNQKAVFNLETLETVPTGGTGKMISAIFRRVLKND